MKTPRFFSILSITMLSSLSITMLSSACFAQTVSNVRFEQVDNKVKITYSLDKQANISVCVSEDGGKTWSSPLKQVSGDVGRDVQAGARTIWWDALLEYNQVINSNICFKVVSVKSRDNLSFTINGQTFTMLYVKGGTFTIGNYLDRDQGPMHSVTLSDFYIGETEVTQALWQAVMGENPSNHKGDDFPVENVSWEDCQTFIARLNSLTGLPFALPTEAQWEYAARGGHKNVYEFKYAGSDNIDEVAWYAYVTDFANYILTGPKGETHIVAAKKSNELGAYDMSGNVAEWCQDRYVTSYNRNRFVDQFFPRDTNSYVVKGGSYGELFIGCEVRYSSDARDHLFKWKDLGMRLSLAF